MRIGARPNVIGAPVDDGLVDRIMDAAKQPLEAAGRRRDQVVQEKNEYQSLAAKLGDLGQVLDGLKSPGGFVKTRAESSHPDILSAAISGSAALGSYEFEVEGLARAEKLLAAGFPDADKTEVGFGFMMIEGSNGEPLEVAIDPGATLKDVATRINETSESAGAGLRATIVNTGDAEEPFRLMVASATTGAAAKIAIDPDTTFLDFKKQVQGKDLQLKFEDVDVTRAANQANDIVDGLSLKALKADPGTKVQVNVTHDVDATFAGIKAFTDKYNAIADYAREQASIDPATGKNGGVLSADATLRGIMRSLQAGVASSSSTIAASSDTVGKQATSRFQSLADVGITTNPKTGALNLDEAKLKEALSADYDGVAKIFTASESGEGVAARLSRAVRHLQSADGGPVKGRMRSLDQMIRQQDQHIERQTKRLEAKEAMLRRQFDAMNSRIGQMQGQQDFLNARFPDPGQGGQQ